MTEERLIEEQLMTVFMNKRPNMLYENTVENCGKFCVEVYLSSDPTDKNFISTNRKMIKKFFDDGYLAAGLGNFLGCSNESAVKKNTAMLKVARDVASNNIVAMSIYSSRWGGFKCVGATATTDKSNPDLYIMGREAIRHIIKEDAKLWNEFVWIEASGAIERLWKRSGGIQIPSAYLPMFMDEKTLDSVEMKDDDPYWYTRIIGRGTDDEIRVDKTIYGFSNKDVINKYIEDRKITIEELRRKYGILEVRNVSEYVNVGAAPETVWPEIRFVADFNNIDINEDMTEDEIRFVSDCLNRIYDVISQIWNINTTTDKNALDIYDAMMDCAISINRATIIRPYELGEKLIPEKEVFPIYKLIPSVI
jgi:hypothetical protein